MCDISSLFTAGLLSISFKQLIRGTFRTSLFLPPLYSVLTRLQAEAFSSELVLKFLLSQMSSHHLSTLPSAVLRALLFSTSLPLTPSSSFYSVCSRCSSPWTASTFSDLPGIW